jgi:hypothetical protein
MRRRALANLVGTALALSLGAAVVSAGAPVATAAEPAVGDVVPLAPARLMDTRDEPGTATVDGLFEGGAAKPDGTSTPLAVTGRGGVPDDAIAVFLNVTAVTPSAAGYLTLHPCDTERPVASNVNFASGDVVANLVLAKVSPDGTVCVFNRGTTHVVVDVNGYVPEGGGFVALPPQRYFESRDAEQFVTFDHEYEGGGRLSAGSETGIRIAGRGGIPTNVTSVMLNVTAVDPSASGHVTLYPCDTDRPLASNLNYAAGDVVANAVFARVNASSNEVCVSTHAETDLIVDVTGYVAAGVQSVGASAPTRLLDTRDGPTNLTVDHLFEGGGPLAGDTEVELVVHDRGNVPGDAAAVFLNVTAVAPDATGHLTVYPCGTDRPLASNLNYTPGAVVPNAVVAKVGVGGKVCIYARATTHLVVDANGHALAPDAPPPTTTCSIGGAVVATSIPQAQCDALVALHDSTGGAGWTTRTGWLTATDPCTWHGVTCLDGGVEQLSFYNNNMVGPLPAEIGDLVDLRHFSVWVNHITDVPPEIGNLADLRGLVLSNNDLIGVPAQIWSLTTLERLEIAYSGITSVPAQVGDLVSLRQLDVSGNALTALPGELTTLAALRNLDVSYNQITALPPGFDALELEALDLSVNPLVMPATLDVVTTMTTLTDLDLFALGIAALPDSIGDLTNLTYMSIASNEVTTLPAALYTLPVLDQLNVSNNKLTALDPAVAELPLLSYLTASSNPWSADLTAALQALKDKGLMQYMYIGPMACSVTGAELQAWVASFDPSWNTGCP